MEVTVNKIDIARGIVFQQLEVSKNTFEERLVCQKKIYLLQSLNVPLGFYFDWYVYGPYSRNLTTYLYENYDLLIQSDFSKYKLSEKVNHSIQTVNHLDSENFAQLSTPLWYELLASLLFIYETPFFWEKQVPKTKEHCYEVLTTLKPKFNPDHCKAAMKCLIDNHFVALINESAN